MIEQLTDWLLDEGRWLVIAMALAIVVTGALHLRLSRQAIPLRSRNEALASAFYGTLIGVMASAHLLAVMIVTLRRALTASPWLVYPLGLALAVPAWWLVGNAFAIQPGRRRLLGLNLWLLAALMAFGLINWPLAVPAALNIAYLKHSRRWVGLALLTLGTVFYIGLFVGGLLFLASGGSFEEFMASR